MENIKSKKRFLKKYTFITTPMIDVICEFSHKGAKIFFNGPAKKSEVWGKSYDHIDIVLDDLQKVLENYDNKIRIKLVMPKNNKVVSYHPSNPDWAYSRIPLKDIPLLKLPYKEIQEIKRELQKIKESDW